MNEQYYFLEILPFISIYLLLIILALVLVQRNEIKNYLPAIIFILCIISYLLIDNLPLKQKWYFSILLSGALLLPFFLWMFAKSLFDDHFEFGKKHFFYAIITLGLYFFLFYLNRLINNETFRYIPQLISLFFVFLSVIEAQKNKSDDVIQSRIQFRNIYIYLISVIVVVTLIFEIILQNGKAGPLLKLSQHISILGLITSLMVLKLRLDESFYFKKRKEEKSVIVEKDTELENKILAAFDNEKIFVQEGLTIGKLADHLNEQEYKIRKVINQNLGFRNFNDLLNQYRIKEACHILDNGKDQKITVLEIAYQIGYQSLGPFNKAFKAYIGMTPTAYKKRKTME